MVFKLILEPFFGFVQTILLLIPELPGMPTDLLNGCNNFLDLIFSNIGLLNIFIPINLIKVVIPLVLVIVNFDHIYKFLMWCVRKIPFNIN